MKLWSKIWFPVAVVTMAAAHTVISDPGVNTGSMIAGLPVIEMTEAPDTVIYPANGYKLKWTEEDFKMTEVHVEDTVAFADDSLMVSDSLAVKDSIPQLTARDTIKAPDSLQFTDPFRYKYYVALRDSATHIFIRDSLIAAGDSLDWPKLDSLYVADSIALAKYRFEQWYNGLSKEERKKYDLDKKMQERQAQLKAQQEKKDSIK